MLVKQIKKKPSSSFVNLPYRKYYDYQLSKVSKFGHLTPGFNVKIVLLSGATGSVSSGNFRNFSVINNDDEDDGDGDNDDDDNINKNIDSI